MKKPVDHTPKKPKENGPNHATESAAPPPGLDAERHARAQRTAQRADLIRSGRLFAAYAKTVVGDGHLDVDDLQAYVDGLVSDLGRPDDPLQRILAEQLTLVHFRLARLQGDAVSAKSTDAMKAYNAGAARLLAELRRLVLSLEALRGKAPAAPKLRLAETA